MTRPSFPGGLLPAASVMVLSAALAASCGLAGAGPNGNGASGLDADGDEPPPEPARASRRARVRPADRGDGPVTWLKGSTHVHTIHSGDSRVPVADVVKWYGERGYDFLVITDHNRVTEFEVAGGPLILQGIELTHNPGSCDPPPPEPDGTCRIHLNGLALGEAALDRAALASVPEAAEARDADARPPPVEWKNQSTTSRVEMYQAGIDKVRQLGGLVQVNHPSWHWGVNGKLLAELGRRGAVLVEVANMGFARWNAGDGSHPSAEKVWDEALSEGVLVFGVASDDAHDYFDDDIERKRKAGRPVYQAGTGWVMVRAARRPDAIRRALAQGDFYATTGVTLERAELTGGALEVEVAAASAGQHEIAFVGQGGAVLARTDERSARFELAEAPAGYLRAVVSRADGARAWVQPVRVPTPR